MPAKKTTSSPFTVVIIVCVVLLVLLSAGALFYAKNQSNQHAQIKKTAVKPTPTPYPLPQGPQTYPFGYGSGIKGPKPSQILIDPYDPKKGMSQTFTVQIKYDKPITYAAVILQTDNKTKTYQLTRTKGTDETGSEWSTTIKTEDTHDYIYNISLDFQSNGEKTSVMPKLTLRAY